MRIVDEHDDYPSIYTTVLYITCTVAVTYMMWDNLPSDMEQFRDPKPISHFLICILISQVCWTSIIFINLMVDDIYIGHLKNYNVKTVGYIRNIITVSRTHGVCAIIVAIYVTTSCISVFENSDMEVLLGAITFVLMMVPSVVYHKLLIWAHFD